MKQKDEVLANWRAVYGELFPYSDPATMPVSDSMLALGVYLLREIEMAKKTTVIAAAYAEGAHQQPSARTRGKAEPTE